MHLGRAQIDTPTQPSITAVIFSEDRLRFSAADETGYSIWQTCPLKLLRRRDLKGSLQRAVILSTTPLIAIQGGGRNSLYPPNKIVIFHDGLEVAIAEVEFSERIRGIESTPGGFFVALKHSVVRFQYGIMPSAEGTAPKRRTVDAKHKGKGFTRATSGTFWVKQTAVWDTCQNPKGLMSVTSDLLVIPGRQPGHIHLIQLAATATSERASHHSQQANPSSSESHSPHMRSPILVAHTHPLSAIACSSDGSVVVTASERGTLLRMWDAKGGRMIRELRRGADKADIWGITLSTSQLVLGRDSGAESRAEDLPTVATWSDKGTVHMWTGQGRAAEDAPGRANSPTAKTFHKVLRSLPKYIRSVYSDAQFRLPEPSISTTAVLAQTFARGIDDGTSGGLLIDSYVAAWVRTPSIQPAQEATATSRHKSRDSDVDWPRKPDQHARHPDTEARRHEGLVLITHGGDWYRLEISPVDTHPPEASNADDMAETFEGGQKLKLVEFRKLRHIARDNDDVS